jgi:hypothetical protein
MRMNNSITEHYKKKETDKIEEEEKKMVENKDNKE